MTTKTRKRSYNMMLSPKYCADWGKWEILREVISNSMDADPNYSVDFTDNEVTVTTLTNPTMSNLLMMGSGTKSQASEDIGVFGEGLKVACMVATRSRMKMRVATPLGTFTFAFRQPDGFEEKCCFAILDPSETFEGCQIKFVGSGFEQLYRSNFYTGGFGGILKPSPTKGMRVYCKNVYITDVQEISLYDWNLKDLKLNRDRNIPDSWSLKSGICKVLQAAIVADYRVAMQLMENQSAYESSTIGHVWETEELMDCFTKAFEELYGDKAVVSSGNAKIDELAAYKGYTVVPFISAFNRSVSKIKTAEQVITEVDVYKPIENPEKYEPQLAELRKLSKMLDTYATVEIYESHPKTRGYYSHNRNIIGISECQFKDPKDLYGTYLHELAHQKSDATDATIKFEHTLTNLCGELAEKLLTRD